MDFSPSSPSISRNIHHKFDMKRAYIWSAIGPCPNIFGRKTPAKSSHEMSSSARWEGGDCCPGWDGCLLGNCEPARTVLTFFFACSGDCTEAYRSSGILKHEILAPSESGESNLYTERNRNRLCASVMICNPRNESRYKNIRGNSNLRLYQNFFNFAPICTQVHFFLSHNFWSNELFHVGTGQSKPVAWHTHALNVKNFDRIL